MSRGWENKAEHPQCSCGPLMHSAFVLVMPKVCNLQLCNPSLKLLKCAFPECQWQSFPILFPCCYCCTSPPCCSHTVILIQFLLWPPACYESLRPRCAFSCWPLKGFPLPFFALSSFHFILNIELLGMRYATSYGSHQKTICVSPSPHLFCNSSHGWSATVIKSGDHLSPTREKQSSCEK